MSQVGAQRRGRPEALEDPAHAAVTEQVAVVGAVGTSEHPPDHTRRFRDRVRRVHAQALLDEVVQTSGFGQPQRGDQTSRRHQVRVIENRSNGVRGFHLRGVPCSSRNRVCENSDSPARQGHSPSTPRSTTRAHRWIRAEPNNTHAAIRSVLLAIRATSEPCSASVIWSARRGGIGKGTHASGTHSRLDEERQVDALAVGDALTFVSRRSRLLR